MTIDTTKVLVKHCSRCNTDKTPSDFARSKDKPSGLCSTCRACANAYALAHRSVPKGRAMAMFKTSRNRAADKGWAFDLTPEWIEEKLILGKCEATGIQLELCATPGGITHFRPWTPSLDRTDCAGGYTKDNVKLVCWMYNQAKGVSTHEDVMKMVEALAHVH